MRVLGLLLFCSVVMSANVSANADVMLRVRPHVVVPPDSDVKLAQLIDGQTLSQQTRQKLEGILISHAPADGEKQELSNTSLMEVLRGVVESERAGGQIKVHVILPKTVVIDTMKREMTGDQVTMELTQAWQPLCSDCRLSIESLSLPRVDNVRDWSLKIKAELPKGSFSIPVDLVRENGSLLPAFISGRLVTKRKVPVAVRMIPIGERLQANDVSWDYKDTSYSYDGVPGVDELTGKHLKQGVRAGDIVFSSLLEKDRAVRRGEMVSVRSSSKGWEVSLNMVAQQDASIGDTVNLKNPKTNNTLTGEVVGQGEVELR
jgi:flagella basal body P-ring formation protein FlgA